MLFWIIASLSAALVVASLLYPLWRPAGVSPSEARDIGVYRDQLAEIDRDLARGLLDPAEAERTRTEVSRRLLLADKAGTAAAGPAPQLANRVLTGTLLAGMLAGSLGLYNWLGAPGYPDISQASRIAAGDALRQTRMSQAEAEALVPATPAEIPAADLELIERLRATVQNHPEELQGWAFLADFEARIGNYPAAARAQEQVIAREAGAADVADYALLIDLQVAAAGGFVSPEVETSLRWVLATDPENTAARYYTGLLYAQTDRPDIAFRLWRDVLNSGADDSLHVQLTRMQIEDMAFRAGADYVLPPKNGPSLADIEAAQDMDPADRQVMIQGMVDGLSDELATQGGPPDKWAQLIASLGVLGDTDQAQLIWSEAQDVFAGDPDALAVLLAAAQSAGVAE